MYKLYYNTKCYCQQINDL